ncbi:MAG: hypothetical protein NZ988_05175 [Thaumarchaeota archaeon]|nr:hypothetical protein [Candidatus Calditenuaceae archaeon]MDW8187418.1 hypothetical protein [Nitrososphaerota archaeon]
MGMKELLAELPIDGRRVVQFGFAGPSVEKDVVSAMRKGGELLVLVNREELRAKVEAFLQGTVPSFKVLYSPVIEHNPGLAPSNFDVALFLNALISVRGKRELLNEAYRLLKHGAGAIVYECYWPTSIALRRALRKALTERPVFKVKKMNVGLAALEAVLEKT